MIEEGFKCALNTTSKGLNENEGDKSTYGNVFGSEGLENIMNGVDKTYCTTFGIDIDESCDADQITGVERKDDDKKINGDPDEGFIENSS